MDRILRALKQGFLYLLSTNESDGENVGRGDVTDKGGAVAGSADVLEKDMGSAGGFSGSILCTEPEDESKHDPGITGEAVEAHKEAADGLKVTEELLGTNQGRPESSGRLPSTPLNRGLRRVATAVPDSDVQQATKRTKRAKDWTAQETELLVTCKLDPSLPKGNAGWERISSGIPGRSSQQCRQRWDTVQKLCKKIKDYCVAHGKEFSQVSKEEFVSMKLGTTFFLNVHWYKMIDDSSSQPTITSSGPAANELNGASTSTHPVGKPILPSSACPNLEVPRPESMPAAFPVEQGPAAVEPTFTGMEPICGSWHLDRQLLGANTKKRCEEARPMLFNLWWLHLGSFLLHRVLKQKVTQQQQKQQQPGLMDRFHAWANITAWLSKSRKRQSSEA